MDLVEFAKANCITKGGGANANLKNISWWESRGWLESRDKIINATNYLGDDATWRERLHCLINGLTDFPSCNCGKSIRFKTHGYSSYCSYRCAAKYSLDKRTATNIARRGVANPFQSEEVKKKSAETCIQKYGVYNVAKSEEIKGKIRQSFEDRFEGGHPMRDHAVREKVIATCLEKYGAPSPFESPEIVKKIEETMVDRYGKPRALQVEEFKSKQVSTTKSRYGVSHFNQRHLSQEQLDMRSMISDITDYSVLGLSHSHTYKVLRDHGVEFQSNKSLGELSLRTWVESLLGRYVVSGYRMGRQELDIYDPVTGIAIEYDGVYWHSIAKGKGPEAHISKTRLAQSNGIRLIHVMSHEWENQQDIVKSRLTNMFGKSSKVPARKCTIVRVSREGADNFFTTTHLNGTASFDSVYGLVHDNELVMVMGVAMTHMGVSIVRYSTKLGHTVVGGLSKLISHCGTHYQGTLTAECDLRWDMGQGYRSVGFGLANTNDPIIREYPDGISGMHLVWDCGSDVYQKLLVNT